MTAPHPTTPRKRAAWRPFALAAIGGAVLVAMGVGVWATLTATAFNVEPQQISSGTLKLTMTANGAGFTQPVSNMAPGDVVNRYVDLTNSGTLDAVGLTLKVTGTGTTALTTDATRGLRVTVTECTGGTWTATSGVCSGTKAVLFADRAVADLATPSTMIAGVMGSRRTRCRSA